MKSVFPSNPAHEPVAGAPHLHIRRASAADAEALAELGARTFRTAYAGKLPHDDLHSYAGSRFTTPRIRAELDDPRSTFLLACEDCRGFRKVGSRAFDLAGDVLTDVVMSRLTNPPQSTTTG